jgi:hypothetical protein
MSSTISTFKTFNADTDIVNTVKEETAPLFITSNQLVKAATWTNVPSINNHDYFGWIPILHVYEDTSATARHLFDVQFCASSGSANFSSLQSYHNLAMQYFGASPNGTMSFGSQSVGHYLVYSIPREFGRDRLDKNLTFIISSSTSITMSFTDNVSNSGDFTMTSYGLRGTMYSGSLGIKSSSDDNSVAGYVFYETGNVFINCSHSALSANTWNTANRAVVNLYNIIGRSVTRLQSTRYFCRAYNQEFNFSNNPTFVDISGNISQSTMIGDPRTYPTTVGLYDDANNLVAIGKIAMPLEKSFDKECIITICLDL